jgi:protein TonB
LKKTEAHPARSLGFLSRLYDGEVPPAERAEFDLHRRVCPECAEAADEFEAVLALYRNAEIPDVDPGLSARITRRIERELRHPESARFIPVKIDLVWASVVIVALAGAIATYSLVRPKTAARVVVLAEKKTPAQAPAPAFAPQAPPTANQPAEPEAQARTRAPERRASAGAARPAAPPAEAPSAAPSGAPSEEGRLDAELSRKAETAPPPMAAMAAPRQTAKATEQPAAGALLRDQSKEKTEEPIQVGPGVTPPVLIKKVEVNLPQSLRRRGNERLVIVEAVISRQGDVHDVRVLKSSPGLDEAVIQAVRQWKYKPAMKDGRPVAVYLTVTFNIDAR